MRFCRGARPCARLVNTTVSRGNHRGRDAGARPCAPTASYPTQPEWSRTENGGVTIGKSLPDGLIR